MTQIPVDGETQNTNTHVEVRNPRTHIRHGRAEFTDYEIYIQTSSSHFSLKQSRVRRRFSEFLWLRRKLADSSSTANQSLPSLPEVKHFGRFKTEFILERMSGLQQFLDMVLKIKTFRRNPYLVLFLQSEFTVREIDIFNNDSRWSVWTIIADLHQEPCDCAEPSQPWYSPDPSLCSTLNQDTTDYSDSSFLNSFEDSIFDEDITNSDEHILSGSMQWRRDNLIELQLQEYEIILGLEISDSFFTPCYPYSNRLLDFDSALHAM